MRSYERTDLRLISALAVAMLLPACAAETGTEPELADVEPTSNSVLVQMNGESSSIPEGTPGDTDETQDKADCAYIQWCNAPADFSEYGVNWGTVCRVRSGCNLEATKDGECQRDVRTVCGGKTFPVVYAPVGVVL